MPVESSTSVAAKHAPRKAVRLQINTSHDASTTRKGHSSTTSTPTSGLSTASTTGTHAGRLSSAHTPSFKSKKKIYSTDTNAAYTRSPAFLSFLNEAENPSSSRRSHQSEEKENIKIPVHVNVLKKGSFEIPKEIPRSPTSLISEYEMTIEHPRPATDGITLAVEVPPSTSLTFTVEIDFLDGTADIVPLTPIPLDEERKKFERETPGPQTAPSPMGMRRSHRQNRSGGWFMKSPDTGLFEVHN